MRRRWKYFLIFISFFVAIVLLVQSVWGTAYIQKSGDITISSGQSARNIWEQIVAQGFTSKVTPWHFYAWQEDAQTQLKAGTYHLEQGEHISEVIKRFKAGRTVPDELTITYPEGFTLEQIAARTAAQKISTEEEILAVAKPSLYTQQFPFLAELGAERTLEGYMFPDTYRLFANDKAEDVVRRFLTTFDQKLTADLRQEALSQDRTLDQIVIMASIIEREVQSDADMATVSGILWKRFDEGIGLDVDATIRYALEKWDEPLTVQDLQIDSPYNTRRYRGLPPGPISNPGLRALIAAIRPESSDYYYYLSTPNGETIFSRANNEHNQNKAKYLR